MKRRLEIFLNQESFKTYSLNWLYKLLLYDIQDQKGKWGEGNFLRLIPEHLKSTSNSIC